MNVFICLSRSLFPLGLFFGLLHWRGLQGCACFRAAWFVQGLFGVRVVLACAAWGAFFSRLDGPPRLLFLFLRV